MYLSQIPGYQRACARADKIEDAWRDRAFIGVNHRICVWRDEAGAKHSVEVRPLSLRMFLELTAVRSPFLVGGRIRPEDVAVVLWRLSPAYSRPQTTDNGTTDHSAREQFVASIAQLPFRRSVRAIDRFIDRMLIDRPPSSGSANSDVKTDTSFAAAIIHGIAGAYHWDEDKILDTPIPKLFQYLRRIQRDAARRGGGDLAYFNPIRDTLTKKLLDRAIENRNAELGAHSNPQTFPSQ